jgi:Na+-translocating ferredoxin:NAD+ oxidoreductase RnfG subunit
MEIDQARKLLLPKAAGFALVPLKLDAGVVASVAAATQTRPPATWHPAAWVGTDSDGQRAGYVLADQAVGKYELIDFAVGFMPDGTLTQVEVLAYRESHGGEIRNAAWRRQFAGRRGPAQVRFGEDIRNISGATLSCQHVTEGVQRLAALAQSQLLRP